MDAANLVFELRVASNTFKTVVSQDIRESSFNASHAKLLAEAADYIEQKEKSVPLPAFISNENHGLDTDKQVFFYENEFYVLSNFSAFQLRADGFTFDTSEAYYHWLRFSTGDAQGNYEAGRVATQIRQARSAHSAYRFAQEYKLLQRSDWDAVKVDMMRKVIQLKTEQHEYVKQKLMATGNRELIENSWRDSFWGWGYHRNGTNMLGKLWMELREKLQTAQEVYGE